MKVLKTFLLFVFVVSCGIFIIDQSVFGKVGKDCNCFDGSVLGEECEAACYFHDGRPPTRILEFPIFAIFLSVVL